MLTKNLFEEILIKPALNGASKLYIVSGYATAAMAYRHIQTLKKERVNFEIELIIGMSPFSGISQINHKGFQELMEGDYGENFTCSYLIESPPVHSKIFTWFDGNEPVCCFLGSANYTQTAFGNNQREVMGNSDPLLGLDYFNELNKETIYCNHIDAENIVNIYSSQYSARIQRARESINQQVDSYIANPSRANIIGLPSVTISLLDRTESELPKRSGLNWGQRPDQHREPNQAYIKLPARVYRTNFFPDRTVHFTVLTDDEKVLICSRAQDNGKAIHTPHNNSLIGEYFRNRLGIPNGQPIHKSDLEHYGRTDVTFYKIDDETYFMDFSTPKNG